MRNRQQLGQQKPSGGSSFIPRKDNTNGRSAGRGNRVESLIIIFLISILALYCCAVCSQLSYPERSEKTDGKTGFALDRFDSEKYERRKTRDQILGKGGAQDNDARRNKKEETLMQKQSLLQSQDLVEKIDRPSCLSKANDKDIIPKCAFDTMGKYLEASAKLIMIHPRNDAIPPHRTIPTSMAANTTYIDLRRDTPPFDGSQTALIEFNPSLLPLTSDLDDKLLDYITGRSHPDISNEEAKKAKYLSIARASNGPHSCGAHMQRYDHGAREHTYLSLALLDDDLQPIPHASAIVHAYQAMLPECYNRRPKMMSPMHDHQVIAARSTRGNPKKDQLFLIVSNANSMIFPIDIRRVPAPTNSGEGWQTKMTNDPVPMIPTKSNEHVFYGSGLQVRFMRNVRPKDQKECQLVLNSNSIDRRKNYHFFDVPDPEGAVDPLTYVELRPHWNRNLRKVNFYAEKFDEFEDWDLVPGGKFESLHNDGARKRDDVIVNQFKVGEPKEQWKEDRTKLHFMEGRGTACCVDINFETNHTFKVGISHTLAKGRGYIHRFYAFSQNPPRFLTVAISGPFCLGGLNKEKDMNAELQIFPSPDNPRKRLNVTNEIFDCPHITFASGIVEYSADKDYVVISYGVNDCYSRSMVVPKTKILELLDVHGTEDWKKWDWNTH